MAYSTLLCWSEKKDVWYRWGIAARSGVGSTRETEPFLSLDGVHPHHQYLPH